ncbi:unnamed protein product [Rotaria socialis]|uniref:Uncharacterized protein n=1 Tax=Rotaria socialis TaxID=392032 RepID=A0A818HY95_9BILA|nr:unnamed protein product [Rotaria socialis]CAF3506449.1 unnamed protein product [Rotaria socialis]CAF3514151.1 unnamed protein product [Rotaria socialis]CAF4288138.1 unnamed protein product [Rotaria socialis]CAF4553220.1 unnamed protein product [Rotaria socialis]
MSFFFGGDKRTPYEIAKDQTRAISTQIRQEKRLIDRQINQCEREIQRLSKDIRKHASNNNREALRILAKGIVRVKHNKSQLYSANANLDTIENAVRTQLTNVKLTGIMQRSADVTRSMSELIKVEQFQSISEQFSKELIKMGIMNEMTSEVIDTALDDNNIEEEIDNEVEKFLNEIFMDKVEYPDVPVNQTIIETVDADNEEANLEQRLQALRS